jgi:NAD-dependent deacetylase
MRKKIVIFSGAGISKESGIETFRESDGTWEKYRVNDVATPDGWKRNRDLCIEFYNKRKEQLQNVHPNDGHLACVDLENDYDVTVITQNVDDLHERAGSSRVIHLHGDLMTLRSTIRPNEVTEWKEPLKRSDKSKDGSPLRPNVVWFGEPLNESIVNEAINEIGQADVIVVVGTSLQVQPAASFPDYAKENTLIIYVDPSDVDYEVATFKQHLYVKIKEPASSGMKLSLIHI